MAFTAKRAISGTWGELWLDGDLVGECTAFSAKYAYNKEEIKMCGQMVSDSKVLSVKGTGSIDTIKINSRFADITNSILEGVDVRFTIIGKLADPDADGNERVAIYNVSFDDATLASWNAGSTITVTSPFTFTRHEFLQTIGVDE